MSQDNEIWNWHTDTQGRVNSVSSGFTSLFGTSAAKDIIGSYFWTFAERLEKPSSGWAELDNAFKRNEKISKFIFHYQTQSQEKIKIALSGEPIFDKNKYIGFSGIGYVADDSEISIPEISQNILSLSVDNLDLGMAIFSPDVGLIEFNQHFLDHLHSSKVKVTRNMSYDAFLITLKSQNKLSPEISHASDDKDAINVHYYFEKADNSFLSIKKTTLENSFVLVKSEIDRNLRQGLQSYMSYISELKQKNAMLEHRIEDYKSKLSDFFNKNDKSDEYFKKMLTFFENNLDIGVFITNTDNTIDTANYTMAQLFGFTTVSMLTRNGENDPDFQKYLKERTQRTRDLIDNHLNRFEHIVPINNYIYQGNTKEVMVFYPSVHNPQKVISLFYPEVHSDIGTNLGDSNIADHKNNSLLEVHQNFVEYIVSDIKNSVNVINGYNQLPPAPTESANPNIYQDNIYQSCVDIVRSISDVMQVFKISSDMFTLNQSIFYCSDIIHDCLKGLNHYINANNLIVNVETKAAGLSIITDKDIFHSALYKIITVLVRSSDKGAKLRIKIIEDAYAEKIDITMVDESKINLTSILNGDVQDIFNETTTRYTGSLNFKIAQSYLDLLHCQITATHQEDRGNTITIHISGDMISSDDERDSDNLVI